MKAVLATLSPYPSLTLAQNLDADAREQSALSLPAGGGGGVLLPDRVGLGEDRGLGLGSSPFFGVPFPPLPICLTLSPPSIDSIRVPCNMPCTSPLVLSLYSRSRRRQ